MNTFWALNVSNVPATTAIVSNAIVATMLAVGVTLLGRFWKNPAALHVLWLVVLLKLFTPPLVTTNLTVPGSWLRLSMSPGPTAGVASTTASDSAEPNAGAEQAAFGSPQSPDPGRSRPDKRWSEIFGRSVWSISGGIIVLWFCGAAGMALRYAILILRFTRLFRWFEPAPPAILLLVEQTAHKLGLKRVPKVWMTADSLPPLVWSVGIAPHLILPTRLFARMDSNAQLTVIAHE